MKTLTITDAKKNLGRLLAAASNGEDIGIICGADIIALRKVTVESADYAQRGYGATPEQVATLDKSTDRRYRKLKRSTVAASLLILDRKRAESPHDKIETEQNITVPCFFRGERCFGLLERPSAPKIAS